MFSLATARPWIKQWKLRVRKLALARCPLHVLPFSDTFWWLVHLCNLEPSDRIRVGTLPDIHHFHIEYRKDQARLSVFAVASTGERKRVDLTLLLSMSTSSSKAHHRQDIIRACRWAIDSQIQAFRETQQLDSTCPFCGQEGLPLEIHHVVPFDFLVQEFGWSNLCCQQPLTKQTQENPDCRQVRLEPAVEIQWQTFHKQHAVLAAVCRTCNLCAPSTQELITECQQQGIDLIHLSSMAKCDIIQKLALGTKIN